MHILSMPPTATTKVTRQVVGFPLYRRGHWHRRLQMTPPVKSQDWHPGLPLPRPGQTLVQPGRTNVECHWEGATKTEGAAPQVYSASCFILPSPEFLLFHVRTPVHLGHTQKHLQHFQPTPASLLSDLVFWLKQPRRHSLALHPTLFCIVCCIRRRYMMGRNQYSIQIPPLKISRKEFSPSNQLFST